MTQILSGASRIIKPSYYYRVLSLLYTIYLFTKSDILLVVTPMLTVATVLAGPGDFPHLLTAFFWLELHLLAFEIKNQLIGLDEDRACKPYRPLPSGRLMPSQANIMYYIVIIICFLFSMQHGLLYTTTIYFIATISYNECGLSSNILAKSPIGAVGYMCYCWGTTYILGHHAPLTVTAMKAIFASGLTFSLTGHAQDFKDRSGDVLLGRITIPIMYSQFKARCSLILAMSITTWGLIIAWEPPLIMAGVFVILWGICSFKFFSDYSEISDRKSFKWYELWLICAHVFPVFERFKYSVVAH